MLYSDFDSNLGYVSIQMRLQTDKPNMKFVDNIVRNKSIAINNQYRENYESCGPNTGIRYYNIIITLVNDVLFTMCITYGSTLLRH